MSDAPAGPGRDELIDLLRSLSTTTVVIWHWVFTIIVWRADGPHADNPIGYVSGLWSLTWVLQVLPLFFVAGGYVHSLAWAPRRGQRGAWRRFALGRAQALGVPALVLIAVVALAGLAIGTVHDGPDPWTTRAVLLVTLAAVVPHRVPDARRHRPDLGPARPTLG